MAREFSFGQIEAVCASLNRIADDKRVAFTSRLKQLQKHDLTDPDSRPGRGRKGTYTFNDLMKFVVGVELIQAGIMPQMAARFVSGSWSGLQYSIFLATHTEEELEDWQEMPFGPEAVDWYWMLTPETLRDMTEEGVGKFDHMEAIMPVPVDEVAERLKSDREIGMFGEGTRMIVLHGTKITKVALFLVEYQFRYATNLDLREELQDEFNRRSNMIFDSPMAGAEEVVQTVFETNLQAARLHMESEARRARYFPSEAVLERQAAKMVAKLEPYLLAYIREEDFAGTETADYRAMSTLLGQGLIVPDVQSDSLALMLTPLGAAVKRLSADLELPPRAIEDWRRKCKAKIHETVQRKIDRLLASDPDNPEDFDALDSWARHGGKPPLSEARSREIAKRFVSGVKEEIGDDPDMMEEFDSMLKRLAGREAGDTDGRD